MNLADAIRAHVDNGAFLTDSDRALLAVVDKCEAMRAEAERSAVGNTLWANALATEFEGLIVRELNVAFPIDQVDEVKRLLGH